VSRRRDQNSEDSRRAILGAARLAFAEKGYAATSLEDIVTPAGLTKGALYHHFANKAAVLEALYVEMEEELVDGVGDAVAKAGEDADAQIGAALDAFLEASSEPSYVRIVLRDAPTVLGVVKGRDIDQRLGSGLTEVLVQSLADQGRIPADLSVPVAARILLALVSEVAVNMSESAHPEVTLREGRDVVTQILRGLRLAAAEDRRTR